MRINNNVGALNAWRNLNATDGALSKNLERLSSGYRINRAADDVAGLAISENMRAQVKGLNQAVKNAQDGISMVQTAEGSLNEVHTMLQRMRELSVQAANGTLQAVDRGQIQTEMDNLAKEVTRITNATQFNSKDLINGSLQKSAIGAVDLQIGPNQNQTGSFSVGAMDAQSLGISRDVMTGQVDNGVDALGVAVANNVVDITKGDAGFGEVGAGLQAGSYTVKFTTNTVQLFDAAGTTAIGATVDYVAGATVTLGDANTARTVSVTLKGGLGPGPLTDTITIGAKAAGITTDSGAGTPNVSAGGIGGVTSVGYGMSDATAYKVMFDGAGNAQLFDSTGTTAIGGAVAIAAGKVTVGDSTTGRTVSLTNLTAVATGTAGSVDIKVQNNGQSAEAAQFAGGVKTLDSRTFAGLSVSNVTDAQAAIGSIDSAIAKVSSQRSQLGAVQNRLEHTINNLQVVSENLTASESRIRDLDMAQEMTQFAKNQILMQAGTAMLAQANSKNQAVLSLLRG